MGNQTKTSTHGDLWSWTEGMEWAYVPEISPLPEDSPVTERDKAAEFLQTLPDNMPVLILTPCTASEMGAVEHLVTLHAGAEDNPFEEVYRRMQAWVQSQDEALEHTEE